ncbi:MAG: ligand-gated channel protein, partial [Myxococcota bacterium]
LGVEGSGSWTSPGDHVRLTANATWLEFRNTSDEGTFGDFAGDRIPNRPWLFANASAQIGASGVVSREDRLTLDWYTRYVHPFFRGWESVGLVQFKQEIPAQLSHAVAVTYAVQTPKRQVSVSAEVQNLTDETLFDFFGVQRPGRSVFGKVTIGL